MLHKSGINLEVSALQFIEANESVTLFSAYIKLEELKRINVSKKINRIIVRWEIQDLCMGSSDLEVYDYCQENGIRLFRNTRIHLKAFWNNELSVVFGSANISNRGLGEKDNYNFELNGNVSPLSFSDILYFNEIIEKSEYVSDELFDKLKTHVDETPIPTLEFPELATSKNHIDYFLISQLPMTTNVERLLGVYKDHGDLDFEEMNCVTHDLVLYGIPNSLDDWDLINQLNEKFNLHPFIIAIKDQIKENGSLNYGRVVRWIQENTTTVPSPKSWELKKEQLVNTLYDWICYFDPNFYWDIPNHSQVIYYNPVNPEKDLLLSTLVESLNRNSIAAGQKSPHQIILLAALYSLVISSEEDAFIINDIIEKFECIWKDHEGELSSENMNIGMPIKAFEAQQLLHVQLNDSRDSIPDYRNKSDLLMKIRLVRIDKTLEHALRNYSGNLETILKML